MSEQDRPRIVVTGPTGWIGSALLTRIAHLYGPGWDRSVLLFGSRGAEIVAPDGAVLRIRPLCELAPKDVAGAVVIHLAYLTKEKVELLGEARFVAENLAIDQLVFTAFADAAPRAVFVASSGAAALAADGRDRHPYGCAKLRQEDRMLEWAARSGVPAIAGRIWNLTGPFINKIGSYAIADMLIQARATGRIRIAARVPVFRSYLHVSDLCDLILLASIGRIGHAEPIDLCGAETLEMSDIARQIAVLVGLSADAIERAPVVFDRPSAYLGQFALTKALAMRVDQVLLPFAQQLADTDRWLHAGRPRKA
ncbi:NAD-dependent epimerase/dehydratase family protein [uncultured Sphingomonas sp.]|uniref:NAD-dependent epimerase/dehydratase family protein n=1 Tax=uncultured Sphingomonas sp. TaxID=158754 RepID=UPI0035CB24D8